jgi:uncharacterized protein (TIGR01319 family)
LASSPEEKPPPMPETKALALTIDFGSTFTKGSLFDLANERVLAIAYEPSTVDTDVTVGLHAVLSKLGKATSHDLTRIPARVCSSAAGGLRMVVVGLVPSLSLEAAQRAALGAGAKIVGAYGHKLSASVLSALAASRPDLVLLAGGIDGGDEETILHNARALAGLGLDSPVIVAGNQFVAGDCVSTLREAGRNATLAANILPEIDRVEVDEVHHLIRELFVKHITQAKGIEGVGRELNLAAPIIPTPAAVLSACQLIAEGPRGRGGLGDLVIVDVGGATTDIHSASGGMPTRPGVIRRGLPELFLKRTVEGDLGVRINAPTIVERMGAEAVGGFADMLRAAGSNPAEVRVYAEKVSADPNYVPKSADEAAIDAALARSAIKIAIQRHAGTVKEVFTGAGLTLVQYGKDLGAVSTVIGVGGVIAYGEHAEFALQGVLATADAPASLSPAQPNFLIDRSYLLYGIGLLAEDHPETAFSIAKRILVSPASPRLLQASDAVGS